jgi:adenylosuccinate lyase
MFNLSKCHRRNGLYKSICKKFSLESLTALSPLDGRYVDNIQSLKAFYSESGLIKYRTIVEVEWVKYLLSDVFDNSELKKKYNIVNKTDTLHKLDSIVKNFDLNAAQKVKEIEKTTNHDVKAVEYYIKSQFKGYDIPENLYELVHFCCTSEDINNLSWSLIVKDSLAYVYHPKVTNIVNNLVRLAEEYSDVPMMSRTHGQSATPTTMGKEIANFAYRINEQHHLLKGKTIKAKLNGAVGNFNAHYTVLPHLNWLNLSKNFIENLGLEFNPYTTQIENHDSLADIFNSSSLINTILIDLSRDFWTYISLSYFKQKTKKGEIGSSTMPHKVINYNTRLIQSILKMQKET